MLPTPVGHKSHNEERFPHSRAIRCGATPQPCNPAVGVAAQPTFMPSPLLHLHSWATAQSRVMARVPQDTGHTRRWRPTLTRSISPLGIGWFSFFFFVPSIVVEEYGDHALKLRSFPGESMHWSVV